MDTQISFSLLGPLQIRKRAVPVAVSAGKQRSLLAALLLSANQMVSTDELIEVVWDSTPPSSVRATLHNYVNRLRNTLADAGESRIRTLPHGYLIAVGDDELDVSRFECLRGNAVAAVHAEDWNIAAQHLRDALSLWHGRPLADVPSELLQAREVPRLAELRLQAVESRIEVDLQLGRHAEVIADLRQLVTMQPLRERLHALLMLALYRAGQQAAAQEVFREVRQTLVDELGTEPGPELRQLHQHLLTRDPVLDLAARIEHRRTAPVQGAGQPIGLIVPRQLPAAASHLTGRATELTALTRLLGGASGTRTAVTSALVGTAGVGKTAVAVHWAHQVAGRFPDGQLYVNLRGYDPDHPRAAVDVLAGFLRALGVPGPEIPDELEERTQMYRSRLAGRRMLVVLDNARDGAQVRPLLPGDPGCAAVVTSRDTLAGLVATEGVNRLDLDVLAPADAASLLRTLIGDRADDDHEAVAELARLCARLPLALRIAAEQAAACPAASLAELAAELAGSRLDGLAAGEDRADVRVVVSWSFRQLPEVVAGAFALLGLHPGDDLDLYAAAALIGTSAGQARRVLGRLHRASLIQARGPGRYGMHDLLRAYAREQAAARDTGSLCRQALLRLCDYYLAATAAAMNVLFPAEAHRRPRAAVTGAALPYMAGEAAARAWLDAERANLVTVVAHAANRRWSAHASDMVRTVHRYLIDGCHLPEAHAMYSHVLQAARRVGHVAAEAEALHGLASIRMKKGQFRDCAVHYQAALQRYRDCGNLAGEAQVLHNLGVTEFQLHDHQAAAGYYRQAITAYEGGGDSVGAAGALCGLANAETELGRYDQAAQNLQAALPVLRNAKDERREARALEGLGELSLRRGELTQAADFIGQALALYRRLDNPAGVANGLLSLGEVSVRHGDSQQAFDYFGQALAAFRGAGDLYGEILTLRSLAQARHEVGQYSAARAELQAALELAAGTGNSYQQASVHCDIAENHNRAGDHEQASHHWQQALTLYAQLGKAAEADHVRSRLSACKRTHISAAGNADANREQAAGAARLPA